MSFGCCLAGRDKHSAQLPGVRNLLTDPQGEWVTPQQKVEGVGSHEEELLADNKYAVEGHGSALVAENVGK